MLGIKFSTKNSVDARIYLPRAGGVKVYHVFNIIMWKAFRRPYTNFQSQWRCPQWCQKESVKEEGGGGIEDESKFLLKRHCIGGQLPETIRDIFQRTPIYSYIFLKFHILDLYCLGKVCIKLTFQFSSHHNNMFKSK